MVKQHKRAVKPGRAKVRISGTLAIEMGVAIVRGDMVPGDFLEGEIAASERLGVSRTAYREAVRILNAKGLVDTRPKTGTRISAPTSWHLLDPDVLSWLFDHDPAREVVEQIFELRGIVEPQMAALAALRRTPETLIRMAEALERMEHYKLTTDEGQLADQDFHAAIIEACGNAFLSSLTGGIGAAVSLTTSFKSRRNKLLRDAVPDHREVYEGIAAGDEFAAHAAMKKLVRLASREAFEENGIQA